MIIDRYNFELFCFKVGAFFETQCMLYNVILREKVRKKKTLVFSCH